jgi:hypothetical protein
VAHLLFLQKHKAKQKSKRATKPTHNDRSKLDRHSNNGQRTTSANSTYKKLAVQWLNEALCFVSSSVVVDSFRLLNRQLLVAAKRYDDHFFKKEYTG